MENMIQDDDASLTQQGDDQTGRGRQTERDMKRQRKGGKKGGKRWRKERERERESGIGKRDESPKGSSCF